MPVLSEPYQRGDNKRKTHIYLCINSGLSCVGIIIDMFVFIVGQSHTLACQIYFPSEKKEKKNVREVQWYVSLGGNMKSMTRLENQT